MNDTNPPYNDIIFYNTPIGEVKIEVIFNDETFWLSQKRMAELFGVDVRTVSEHLQNIFKTNELSQNSVVRNFRITASDGKNYNTQFYNLDAIIAVGYRVNSYEATQFRIWATKTLREFIIRQRLMAVSRCKLMSSRYENSRRQNFLLELTRIIDQSRRVGSESEYDGRIETCDAIDKQNLLEPTGVF